MAITTNATPTKGADAKRIRAPWFPDRYAPQILESEYRHKRKNKRSEKRIANPPLTPLNNTEKMIIPQNGNEMNHSTLAIIVVIRAFFWSSKLAPDEKRYMQYARKRTRAPTYEYPTIEKMPVDVF